VRRELYVCQLDARHVSLFSAVGYIHQQFLITDDRPAAMTLFVFFSICHHFCNLEASTWDIGSRNLKFPQTRPVNFCDNWGSRCRWLDAISFTSPLACSSLIAAHVRASSLSIQTKFTFRGKTPLVYRIRALFPCTRSVWLTVFLLMCSLLRPSIGLNDSDGWAGECEMSTFLSGRCYKCVFSVFGVWCFARSFLSLHLRFPRPQVMAAIFTPPSQSKQMLKCGNLSYT